MSQDHWSAFPLSRFKLQDGSGSNAMMAGARHGTHFHCVHESTSPLSLTAKPLGAIPSHTSRINFHVSDSMLARGHRN